MPTARVAMQQQDQGQWCWAAVASSMAAFYGRGVPQQCAIASALLDGGIFDCCAHAREPFCDRRYVLELALAHVHVQVQGPIPPIAFDQLVHEIGTGRPVAIGVDLGGGSGHFAVIDSCEPSTRTVQVQDPLLGPSELLDFDFLTVSYRNLGPWLTAYLTA
jgi:hypothetical protein